jgi:hypothetical protein
MSAIDQKRAAMPLIDVDPRGMIQTPETPSVRPDVQPDDSDHDAELDADPSLAGIPAAVIANTSCYDTDSVGGCG